MQAQQAVGPGTCHGGIVYYLNGHDRDKQQQGPKILNSEPIFTQKKMAEP